MNRPPEYKTPITIDKAQSAVDKFCADNDIDTTDIEDMLHEHMRTPYLTKKDDMKCFKYNDAKHVIVCGDIHGDFQSLVTKSCVIYGLKDTLIIVAGDCGFGFEVPENYVTYYNHLAGKLKKANNWIVFVRGNHDDPSYFQEEKVAYKRFRCVPDYSVIQACGHNILCIGGGVSIDRRTRIENNHRYAGKTTAFYWSDEMPVFDEGKIQEISDNLRIDTVVSHTAPSFCPLQEKNFLKDWSDKDPDLLEDCDRERKIMDDIFFALKENKHPVESWYYGHFHQTYHCVRNDVKFRMLDELEFIAV